MEKSIFTKAVHAGRSGIRGWSPVVPPVHNAATYLYRSMDELEAVLDGRQKGYVYSRFASPTCDAFERAVAELEGAESAVSFASGMAAIHAAVVAAVPPGGSVVASRELYGATSELLAQMRSERGIEVIPAGVSELAGKVIEARPRAVLLETMGNPLLAVADVDAIAMAAKRVGAEVIVDGTFTTAFLVRVLDHGADWAVTSATKYLGGHGDLLGGVVACSADRAGRIEPVRRLLGANLGPAEAYLGLRGLRTLPLRMERQCANAVRVAEFLEGHPGVEKVHFPGLASHPSHDTARRLLRDGCFGAIVSFSLEGAGTTDVDRFFDSLETILPATSLGDVHSMILHPARSSHRGLAHEERLAVGITDSLVRLSVGIEDAGDIVADLDRALGAI